MGKNGDRLVFTTSINEEHFSISDQMIIRRVMDNESVRSAKGVLLRTKTW